MKHTMILKLLAYGIKFLLAIHEVLVLSDPASKGSGNFCNKLSISIVGAQHAASLTLMSSGLIRGKMSHRYALDGWISMLWG